MEHSEKWIWNKFVLCYSLHFMNLLMTDLFPLTKEDNLLGGIDYSHQVPIPGCLGLNPSVQLCLCGSQKFIGWSEIGGFCCLNSLHSASPMERSRTQIKSMGILHPPFWPDFSTTQRPVMWSTSVAKCWYQQSHSVGFLPFVIVKLQNPILIQKHRFATRIHNILAGMLCPFCWYLYWVHSGTSMWFHIWLPRCKGIGEGSMLNQLLNRRICQEKKGRRGTGLEVQGTWIWSWSIFVTNYMWPCISHFTFQGTNFLIFNMWQINVFHCQCWLR